MTSSTERSQPFNRVLGVMYLSNLIPGASGESGPLRNVEEDLEKIRRMGFNTVYFFDIYRDPDHGATHAPFWYPKDAPATMKPLIFGPESREAIEDGFEAVFRVAWEKGLKVIPSVCYSVPLQWLWSNLDAAKRTADGSLHYTVYYHECFRSEKLRRYTRGRLVQLLARYADNGHFSRALARFRVEGTDAVLDENGRPLFVIHNDTVDRGFCYCETCLTAWREEFLPGLYADMAEFNRLHGTDYDSFDQVPLPKDRSDERLWNDLGAFFTEGLMGWMEVIGSTIREHIPDALLSIVMKYPRSRWAVEYPDLVKVSELCDVLSMDSYPMEGATTWNVKGYAYDLETYRSISLLTGKPMLSQFQLAASYEDFDMKLLRAPRREEILQQFYVSVGRGTRGMVCWGFPPGIADDGCPEQVMDEGRAIEAARLINSEARSLFAASDSTREVYGQLMLPYNHPGIIMEEESIREPFELYLHLSRLGLMANPTFTDFMVGMADRAPRYDAIVGFASLGNIRKEHAEGLVPWLEKGGAMLYGASSFQKDEKGDASGLVDFNERVLGPSMDGEDSLRRVGRGVVERAGIKGTTGPGQAAAVGLLGAFVQRLPHGPLRVTCDKMDNVDFSLRRGEDLAIVYLVNNNPEARRLTVQLRPPLLDIEAGGEYAVSDTVTGHDMTSIDIGRGDEIRFDVDLPPLGSKAVTVRGARQVP
jgi:hypothetical protein